MTRWLIAPDPLPALGGDVHLWAVTLDDPAWKTIEWRDILSAEELTRADRFKFDRDRRRYVIAHAALRDVLARYTAAPAASLQFIEGANGKPRLAAPLDGVAFNLSHSNERALLAVNDRREVGVDLEFVKADFEFLEVAQHFFTGREVAGLQALPESLRRRAFYKCWTSKEAFLKAKGTGLSGDLDEVEILLAGQDVRIAASVTGWTLTDLEFGDDYEAALVTQNNPARILCYRWQGEG